MHLLIIIYNNSERVGSILKHHCVFKLLIGKLESKFKQRIGKVHMRNNTACYQVFLRLESEKSKEIRFEMEASSTLNAFVESTIPTLP